MDVTAILPIKQQSERLPRKNFLLFDGEPLFHHVLHALHRVSEVSRVILDTDSAELLRRNWEDFPKVLCVSRPPDLCGGHVAMTEIIRSLSSRFPADWYLQTHATNPLVSPETFQGLIQALDSNVANSDSLLTVNRIQARLYNKDFKPINHDFARLERTQDLDPVFEENSCAFLFQFSHAQAGRRHGVNPLLFETDPLESIDIDDGSDFRIAEAIALARRRGFFRDS